MTNWFQSDEYFNFIEDLGFLEPFKVSVFRNGIEKGRIVGYIQKDGGKLKQFFSRRAIVNGGPQLAEDITEEEVLELLESCKKELKGKCIYIETRNFDDYSKFKPLFQKAGFSYEAHYNFKIDTSSVETIEENLGKSRKRDIRTSLRDGAEIVAASTIEEIREYYNILEDLYKTKVRTPLFPLTFFKNLFSSDFGKIILVKLNNKVIGGTVLACGSDIIYEWFACGKDGIYKNIYPSTLATYGGIKYAEENGFKVFDMMGAGAPGDGGYGVRDFKAKFGGELVEHGRFKCILNKPLYNLGTFAVKLMKKLK